MSLLDGDLQRLFGAVFAAVYRDATLAKSTDTDTGTGGFAVAATNRPVKAMVSAMSDRARADRALPESAVTISLLRAGMTAGVDLDDLVFVAGLGYRIIRVESDPAGAAWSVVAVPVLAA